MIFLKNFCSFRTPLLQAHFLCQKKDASEKETGSVALRCPNISLSGYGSRDKQLTESNQSLTSKCDGFVVLTEGPVHFST